MRDERERDEESVPGFVDFDCLAPSMQDLILDYLQTHAEVTFIDLEDEIPDFAGELTLKASENRQTIFWRGISHSGIHALAELERQGQIEFRQTSCQIYQSRGRRLHLPVAKRESVRLHWTPVFVELRKH
jgi:hypothetical protein